MSDVLKGLRVVELGSHVAVPMAARIMADWGAEVIKIEPPKGEDYRTMGRTYDLPHSEDHNVMFQLGNAGKKSLPINLKSPEGKEVLLKLFETTDIFLTNTRHASMERLGLDYDTIKARFPKLIYAEFTAFGLTGPDKDRPGFDIAAYWARSGALIEWSEAESTPSKPMGGFGDSTSGSMLLAGILATLYKRDKTGQGGHLDLSLYGAALWYNAIGVLIGQEQFGHHYPKSRYNQYLPTSPLYKTKDGDWVLISAWNWGSKSDEFLTLFGITDWVGNPEYNTIPGAKKNIKIIIERIEKAIAQISTKDLLAGLLKMDVVYEKLANPSEPYKDPQAWENGYLREITFKNGEKAVVPVLPLHFDGKDTTTFTMAPHLGQDSAALLKELGYSDAEVKKLAQDGAVIVRG
ncbi:MAG: CoA transferase [Ruminococcaceae bacterium]|nr:CoA transferase [Oscillospiraceae bacterium]